LVFVEDGIPAHVVEELRAKGHKAELLTGYLRARFGRGQIIRASPNRVANGSVRRVYMAGSDGRADGCAIGY
jgi:gamma-glutamyltranspeptidase/glutathione hydrolase